VGKVFGKKKFCHLSAQQRPTSKAKAQPNGTHRRSQMLYSGQACIPFLYY